MKKIKLIALITALLIFPASLSAQTAQQKAEKDCGKYEQATATAQKIKCYANYGIDHCSDYNKTDEFKKESKGKKDQQLAAINKKYDELKTTCKNLSNQNSLTNDLQFENQKIESCIKLDKAYKGQVGECANSNLNEEQIELQKALDNNFIYQILEEPLGTENLLKRQTVCTYNYLRDKNGFYQVADQSSNVKISDPNYYKQEFTLVADTCFEFFVDKCTPKPLQSNRHQIIDNLGDPTELPTSITCKTVQLIYGSSGTDFIKQYVGFIYRLAASIIGVIAVLVIVVSGIQISVAGDDSAKIGEAKERIIQSLFGLAVLFLAGIILRSVNPNFFTAQDVQITTPTQTTQSSNN